MWSTSRTPCRGQVGGQPDLVGMRELAVDARRANIRPGRGIADRGEIRTGRGLGQGVAPHLFVAVFQQPMHVRVLLGLHQGHQERLRSQQQRGQVEGTLIRLALDAGAAGHPGLHPARGVQQLRQHPVARRVHRPEPPHVSQAAEHRPDDARRLVFGVLDLAAARLGQRRGAVLQVDHVVAEALPGGKLRLGHACAAAAELAQGHAGEVGGVLEVLHQHRHAIRQLAGEDAGDALWER